MKIQDLKQLMGSLSLHEKIGQLVQLDGGFFGAEEVPTGPCDEMGIAPWVVENAGSVLNVLGVNKVQEVQQHGQSLLGAFLHDGHTGLVHPVGAGPVGSAGIGARGGSITGRGGAGGRGIVGAGGRVILAARC